MKLDQKLHILSFQCSSLHSCAFFFLFGLERAHPQNPGDVAGTQSLRGQPDHFPSRGLGERSSVEERPSELVHAAATFSHQTTDTSHRIAPLNRSVRVD